jgi:hypothetical protein
MKWLITLVILFWASTSHASPIDCKVTDGRAVIVTMEVPHPKHALVLRPGGETVWLQTSSDFLHAQVRNFGERKRWIITPHSKGTVWVDGKATVQPVITGEGKYHLYIAENAETERENTYFIECYFVVRKEWRLTSGPGGRR